MPKLRKLEDYRAPGFTVDSIEMNVDIRTDKTLVRSTLAVTPSPNAAAGEKIRLFGKNIRLLSVRLNGEPLASSGYIQDEDGLLIVLSREPFVL
ncbi:MAG: hypothetical protein KC649_04545, partial [Candidatus Omnitrophica bacterium]|nr:hypothetical protein [Candidatus Omnitrophota bacterium]